MATRSRSTSNPRRYEPQVYDSRDHYAPQRQYAPPPPPQSYVPQGPGVRRSLRDDRRRRPERRSSPLKDHFVAALGEFVGTFLFLWFAFAWHVLVGSQGGIAVQDTVAYLALGYGFSLLVAAWSFYRISGGLFNPAVVLGLCLTGSLPIVRGIFLFPAEILGALCAAALVECMFPYSIALTNTGLADGVSVAQGVFIEMFLTSLLIFTIHMLAAEKSKVTFLAPLGIGLALFVAELAGVGFTGGSLNPARSFAPAVVSTTFESYHWIYWVGPFLGSILSAGYYRLNKALNYEEANPGQDSAAGDFIPSNV